MKCFPVAFLTVCLISSSVFASSNGQPEKALPTEPDEEIRLEEIYDHESQMVMFLYSLKGNGEVDYVTGEKCGNINGACTGIPSITWNPFRCFTGGTIKCGTIRSKMGSTAMRNCTRKIPNLM